MLTTFVDPVIVPRNVDVVADRFVIVPLVTTSLVDVVVPVVRVGINPVVIVPDVKMQAVPVVVPAVSVGIVPSVMLAVLDVKLAIVPLVLVRARLDVGAAFSTKSRNFIAVTSLVTPS